MSKGLIVVKKPGIELPTSYLDKVFEQYPTAVSWMSVLDGDTPEIDFAVLDGNKFNLRNSVTGDTGPLKTYPNEGLIFHFLNHEKHDEADDQPYSIIDDGTTCYVAAVMDSECQGFKPDEGFTPEYAAVKTALGDHINDLYAALDGDFEKMHTELSSPKHRLFMKKLLLPRGALTLLIANKDPNQQMVRYTNELTDQISAEGFWASRALGWKPVEAVKEKAVEKQETITAVVPKKESLLERKKREAAERASTGEVKADPVVGAKALPAPGSETDGPKTESTITKERFKLVEGIKVPANITVPEGCKLVAFKNGAPIIVPNDTKVFGPPGELHGKALGKWYDRHFGYKPDNFESNRPALPTYDMLPNAPSRKSVVDQLGSWMAAFKKPNQTEEEALAVQEREQEKAENIRLAQEGRQDVPLFVPARAAKDIRKKLEDVQLLEKGQIETQLGKVTPANEDLNLTLEEMFRLPTKTVQSIINTNPHTMLCMWMQACGEILKARPQYYEHEKKPKAEKPVAEPTGPKVPAAVVEKKPESLLERKKREAAERASGKIAA